MTTRIKRYTAAVGLALAAATMAIAQHLDPDDGKPAVVRDAAPGGKTAVMIGEPVDPARLHPVSRPGLYGISSPPDGSRLGVVDGRLIRYDDRTMQVQSVIRPVDLIVD